VAELRVADGAHGAPALCGEALGDGGEHGARAAAEVVWKSKRGGAMIAARFSRYRDTA